jgi:signal transduction histidine kinase
VAPGALTRTAVAAALLVLGAVAELAAPDVALALRAADFMVGATIGCLAAWSIGRSTPAAVVGAAVAVTWFLGTLADAHASWAATVGAALVLAYRGPLVHLLAATPDGRPAGRAQRLVAAAAWVAAVLPLKVAGPATATLAAVGAVAQARRAHSAPVDRRAALWATAGCLCALTMLWAAAATGVHGTGLLLANDAAVLVAAAVALTATDGLWARGGAGALVVELGDRHGAAMPVTERIARALADPELEIRYALPSGLWIDERGRPVVPPGDSEARAVTRAAAPGGGEVALLHGAGAIADRGLVSAAAAAAALALDAARLDADVRARAAEVRASRGRLLAAADGERRALSERLDRGPVARLRRVRRTIERRDAALGAELDAAMAELAALGRGLYPPSVALRRLPEALREMAASSPVPAQLTITGDAGDLSDELQAAIWFICAEALTNVARHSGAAAVELDIRVLDRRAEIAIRDDGRGGATLERGLRGLSDRVEAQGGRLSLDSPVGGPTLLRAELPRSPR